MAFFTEGGSLCYRSEHMNSYQGYHNVDEDGNQCFRWSGIAHYQAHISLFPDESYDELWDKCRYHSTQDCFLLKRVGNKN